MISDTPGELYCPCLRASLLRAVLEGFLISRCEATAKLSEKMRANDNALNTHCMENCGEPPKGSRHE